MLWIDYKPYPKNPILREEINTEITTNQFVAFMTARPTQTVQKDEYERYIQEPVIPQSSVQRPLQWWLDPIQRNRFPNLSLMALDILSIPAMSADTERLFSQAKLVLSDQRKGFDAHSLQILQCLKSWDQSSLLSTTIVSILFLHEFG